MEDKFDLKELQKRITEVKQETEYVTKFTQDFLECLIKRHDLQNIIYEAHEFENIPDDITQCLKDGKIPTEDQLSTVDSQSQDNLIKECIFICGMGAIAFYSETSEDEEENTAFDDILEMSNESPAHYLGMHLMSVLALLFCRIPSFDMVKTITKDFDSSQGNIEYCLDLYNEFCLSLYSRFAEDKEYYLNGK